jgi:hypothetical protein
VIYFQDLKKVFSVSNRVDLANEYFSYNKKDKAGREYEILRDEIESRIFGDLSCEDWVRKYKMSNTDEKNLLFYKTLVCMGYNSIDDIMSARLSVLRRFVSNVYGFNGLWEGSIDGKGYKKGVENVIPENVRGFCRNKFEDGFKVQKRICS